MAQSLMYLVNIVLLCIIFCFVIIEKKYWFNIFTTSLNAHYHPTLICKSSSKFDMKVLSEEHQIAMVYLSCLLLFCYRTYKTVCVVSLRSLVKNRTSFQAKSVLIIQLFIYSYYRISFILNKITSS